MPNAASNSTTTALHLAVKTVIFDTSALRVPSHVSEVFSMTSLEQNTAPVALGRRPYETPLLADFGTVAAVTASIDKVGGKDGGSNKIKT